jgi:CTP:phosphocholine cytidylyltransferase-like protein
VLTWYWVSNTYVSSVAIGNATGSTTLNVVAGGAFYDNTRWNAFVTNLNGTTSVPIWTSTWYWLNNTQVASVAVGDVNGDGKGEVVAGGSFFDNTRYNAWTAILNGTTSAALNVQSWYWVANTYVTSVAIGNFSGGIGLDIVTGG